MPEFYDNVEIYYLGEDVAYYSCYRYKKIVDSGARYSIASDYPAGGVHPAFLIFQTGATREYYMDPNSLRNEAEKMTRKQLIDGISIGGCDQMGRLNETGTIEVGKNADMLITHHNLETCSDEEIYYGQYVEMILIDGKETY